jgi:hypothetical protein
LRSLRLTRRSSQQKLRQCLDSISNNHSDWRHNQPPGIPSDGAPEIHELAQCLFCAGTNYAN